MLLYLYEGICFRTKLAHRNVGWAARMNIFDITFRVRYRDPHVRSPETSAAHPYDIAAGWLCIGDRQKTPLVEYVVSDPSPTQPHPTPPPNQTPALSLEDLALKLQQGGHQMGGLLPSSLVGFHDRHGMRTHRLRLWKFSYSLAGRHVLGGFPFTLAGVFYCSYNKFRNNNCLQKTRVYSDFNTVRCSSWHCCIRGAHTDSASGNFTH